jgi:hypothetical protein
MSTQPGTVTWSVLSGGGSINANGLYTAPSTAATVTIKGQSGSTSGTATVLVGNPQGYWKFNETSGTTAADSSGNNYTATLNGGCTWTTGISGNGLSFDGSTGYVSASINVSETAAAVSFWFKTTSANVGLFEVTDGSGSYDRSLYLCDGNVKAYLYNWQYISSGGPSLADGQWHNVVYTYGSAVAGEKLYIDGILRASGNKTQSDFNWDNRVYIGYSDLAAMPYFQGTMDDVRIYASAMSAANVAYLMNLPPTDITLSGAAIPENQPAALVGTLATVDPNTSDAYTYMLRSDPTGKFEISGATLKLKAGQSLDFETMPSVTLTIRTYNSGGLYFDKAFTIAVIDMPEVTVVIASADWTTAGTSAITLKLAADGKLHFYKTGTTTDVVPPQAPANVFGIDVTGRSTGDVLTVDSMGTGVPSLAVHNVTLIISRNNAISAGTSVTIDAGVLDFNGHSDNIGNLLIINGGQAAVTTLSNNTTTVKSGTLTATSIICDTLTIGVVAGASESTAPAVASGTALTKNAAAPLATNVIAAVSDENAGDPSAAGDIPRATGDSSPSAGDSALTSALAAPTLQEQPIPRETISADSFAATGNLGGDSSVAGRLETIVAMFSFPSTISVEVTPILHPAQNITSRSITPAAGDSLPQSPSNWLPAYFPTAEREGQQTRLAAVQSVVQEYRERTLEGDLNYGYIHRNRFPKHTTSIESAVDAVLVLEDVFAENR